MNDDKNVNPHTGQPVPDDPKPAATGPDPRRPDENVRPKPEGLGAADPAYELAAQAPSFAKAQEAATAAPSQQEMAVRAALEMVMDPEINLSVIDLGLIREIRIEPGKTSIKMMLTTPFCPYAPQMIEDVKQATMAVLPQECEVELLPDTWSPEMMPDPSLLGYMY
jgi:metal-sulfur cluster biosynthetic enzyme